VTTVLQADSIGKRFGRRTVLSASTLCARAGQILALLGRNGSGKSTLLKIAAGWMRADWGVVLYQGDRVPGPHLWQLARRGLFYLPEHSLLSPAFTLRRHFDALTHHMPGAAVSEAVELLDLGDLLDRRPRALSSGERRRAALAIALARRPRCLLADEPFLRIAPRDAETLAGAFRALASTDCAIVITGHETPFLLDLADEVLWQTAGTTHPLGPPSAALANDAFRDDYLGSGSQLARHADSGGW